MQYRPKIIKGTVKGTGWPIDGTHSTSPSGTTTTGRAGTFTAGTSRTTSPSCRRLTRRKQRPGSASTIHWKALQRHGRQRSGSHKGPFCLTLEQVDVVEVLQEEVRNETREELRARGFDLTPRKYSDKGGILCLPLDKNLNGDTKKNTRTGN